MGYIGRGPVKSGAFRIIDDISSSFNGSTTGFTIQHNSSNLTPGTEQNLLVAVDGVMQEPVDAFTISGSTITFTSAPASGASFWGVELGDVGGIASSVANGAVDSTQIANGSIDLAHMSVNSIDSDQYVDGSIDLAHMSVNSIDSDQYVDGSIDTVHIDALQVTGAKIANDTITEGKLDVSNGPTNGQFLQAQSGEGGGLTWADATSTFIGVRVENSSHQSINNNSSTAIVFDASVTQFDTDTMHSSSNSSRITFTTAGKYFVAVSYAWAGATGGRRNVSCRKNGSGQIHRQTISPNTNDELHNGYSFIYEFSANDYVEFIAHQTSGSALLMMADNESSTVAMAYKID